MAYEIITTLSGVLALGAEWRELERRAPAHLFQSHGFGASWLACAGESSNAVAAVALYREEGRLCGIFPGCVINKGGVRFLTWLGGFFAVDYGGVLFDPSADCSIADFMEQALRLLRQQSGFRLCYLHNVRHDAPEYPWLKQQLHEFRGDVAPYIALQGDFDSYLDSLKQFRKKQKSDTLRQIKRLSQKGELEFRIVAGSDPRASALLEAFFEQKRWRFRSSGVHGVLLMPGYEEFYRDQARHNDSIHLSYLALNGEIIATHLGYCYQQRFYYLMPSYDYRYASYSPGRVLAYYLIRDCFAQGVELFDFSIGSEEYKYEWTKDQVPITSFVSNTFAGRLFCRVKKGKIRLDRYLNTFRKGGT